MLSRLVHRLPLLTGGPRDLPARQRTLRDTIAWSYDLLEAAEQALFRHLAVFVGSFNLEEVHEICVEQGGLDVDVLDIVTSLVDKSLVRRVDDDDDPRFGIFETIREFAHERLETAGHLDAARDRHARYFLALAEDAVPRLRGKEQLAWLGRLELEHDNLRAALEWYLSRPDGAEPGLRLGAALAWFWQARGHLTEGRRWLERALTIAPVRSAARMQALVSAGWIVQFISQSERDLETCRTYLDESLSIARELGDRWWTAWALQLMGRLHYYVNDAEGARSYGEEVLAIAQELRDQWLIAYAFHLLGLAAHIAEDYPTAGSYYEQSLALREEMGDMQIAGVARRLAGLVAMRQGDYARAHTIWVGGLSHTQALGNRHFAGLAMTNFASLAAAQQQWDRAVRLAGAADMLMASSGTVPIPLYQAALNEALDGARRALSEAAYADTHADGRAMTMEQAIAYAMESPPPT